MNMPKSLYKKICLMFVCLMAFYTSCSQKKSIDTLLSDFKSKTREAFHNNINDSSKKVRTYFSWQYKNFTALRGLMPKDTLQKYFDNNEDMVIIEYYTEDLSSQYFMTILTPKNKDYEATKFVINNDLVRISSRGKVYGYEVEKYLVNRGAKKRTWYGDCFVIVSRYSNAVFDVDLLYNCKIPIHEK